MKQYEANNAKMLEHKIFIHFFIGYFFLFIWWQVEAWRREQGGWALRGSVGWVVMRTRGGGWEGDR